MRKRICGNCEHFDPSGIETTPERVRELGLCRIRSVADLPARRPEEWCSEHSPSGVGLRRALPREPLPAGVPHARCPECGHWVELSEAELEREKQLGKDVIAAEHWCTDCHRAMVRGES